MAECPLVKATGGHSSPVMGGLAAGPFVEGEDRDPFKGLAELAAGLIVEGAGGCPSQGLVEFGAGPHSLA